MELECAGLGAIFGLIAAPAFMWGMWYDAGCVGAAIVLTVTGAAAFLFGLMSSPVVFLFSTMVCVTLYVGLSIGIGIRTRKRRDGRTSGACRVCEYPLVGLSGAVCPECGAALPTKRAAGAE